MNELLQALAQEIRQTSLWLSREKTPDTASIRFRLHTLREAAATADMKSVEQALGKIESRLDSSRPASMDEILDHLSKLVLVLAQPVLKSEQLWLAELDDLENELKAMITSMNRSMDKLLKLASLSDNTLLQSDMESSGKALISISRDIKNEIAEMRSRRTRTIHTTEKLHRLFNTLMNDFSHGSAIPLDPAFARLRQKVRKWSKNAARPVALSIKTDKVIVATAQYDDITRLLDIILQQIVTKGLDDPESRSRAGKPTVAGISIEGGMEQDMVQLAISHDGKDSKRPISLASTAMECLRRLRARLWTDDEAETGQRVVIHLPLWHSTTEAIKVESEVGEVFVPVSVVTRLTKIPDDILKDLPVIHLDRRSKVDDPRRFSHALIFSRGYWQAYLPCNILYPTRRIIMNSPGEKDPLWVWGRTDLANESFRVIHPLAFSSTPKHWRSIFPMESKL